MTVSSETPSARLNPDSRDLDTRAIALMVLCCASWALSSVAVKLALPDMPPLIQATLRSIGALPVVLALAWWRGENIFLRDGTLKAGLLVGVLFFLEFVLIYRSLTLTTASRVSVFLYTAPFFVALGTRRFLGERLRGTQWCGLALSFIGVTLAIGLPQPSVDLSVITGDLMALSAGIAWAATTLVAKASRLKAAPATKTLSYQLAMSIPLLGIGAVLSGERITAMPGALAWSSLVFQSVWVVGITFFLWYALMRNYSANKLSAFTFLTPLLGVAAGVVILDEPMSMVFALAALLVIAGLVLVNRPAPQEKVV
jgi:drug/metabolite transporter (DMT)-like permease